MEEKKIEGASAPLLEIEDLHVHYKARGKLVYAINRHHMNVQSA